MNYIQLNVNSLDKNYLIKDQMINDLTNSTHYESKKLQNRKISSECDSQSIKDNIASLCASLQATSVECESTGIRSNPKLTPNREKSNAFPAISRNIGSDSVYVETNHNSSMVSVSFNNSLQKIRSRSKLLSRLRPKSSIKQDLLEVHSEFDANMKALEKMLVGIKQEGFDKIKDEIERKKYIKSDLELRIERLTAELNFYNSQKKKFGTKNLVYEQLTKKANHQKEVSHQKC